MRRHAVSSSCSERERDRAMARAWQMPVPLVKALGASPVLVVKLALIKMVERHVSMPPALFRLKSYFGASSVGTSRIGTSKACRSTIGSGLCGLANRQVIGAAFTQLPVAGLQGSVAAWAVPALARRSVAMKIFFMEFLSVRRFHEWPHQAPLEQQLLRKKDVLPCHALRPVKQGR